MCEFVFVWPRSLCLCVCMLVSMCVRAYVCVRVFTHAGVRGHFLTHSNNKVTFSQKNFSFIPSDLITLAGRRLRRRQKGYGKSGRGLEQHSKEFVPPTRRGRQGLSQTPEATSIGRDKVHGVTQPYT